MLHFRTMWYSLHMEHKRFTSQQDAVDAINAKTLDRGDIFHIGTKTYQMRDTVWMIEITLIPHLIVRDAQGDTWRNFNKEDEFYLGSQKSCEEKRLGKYVTGLPLFEIIEIWGPISTIEYV